MFVKHPTSTDDGTLSVATPQGVRQLPMTHGVVEWPDDLPLHNRFVACEAPAALVARLRAEEESAFQALAKKLGFAVHKDAAPPEAEVPPEAEAPAAKDPAKKGK